MILFPLMMMLLPVAGVGIFAVLALRYVRAKEQEVAQRGLAGPSDTGELARLYETVAALQEEVGQLRERQDFMERLLESPRESR